MMLESDHTCLTLLPLNSATNTSPAVLPQIPVGTANGTAVAGPGSLVEPLLVTLPAKRLIFFSPLRCTERTLFVLLSLNHSIFATLSPNTKKGDVNPADVAAPPSPTDPPAPLP